MNLNDNVRYVNWFLFQININHKIHWIGHQLEVPLPGLEQVPGVPAGLAPAWLCGVREKPPGRDTTIRVAQRTCDIMTGMEVFD